VTKEPGSSAEQKPGISAEYLQETGSSAESDDEPQTGNEDR